MRHVQFKLSNMMATYDENYGIVVSDGKRVAVRTANQINVGDRVFIRQQWQDVIDVMKSHSVAYPHDGDPEIKTKTIHTSDGSVIIVSNSPIWNIVNTGIPLGKSVSSKEPEKVETEEERLEKLLKPSSEEFWGIC